MRGRPGAGDSDPVGVGDGRGVDAGRERAVGRDAHRIRGGDDLADRLGAKFRRGRGGVGVEATCRRLQRARHRQTAPVRELLDDARDRNSLGSQGPQARVVGSPGGRHADPLADHHPQVDRHLALRDVLVDLTVGEAGERAVFAHDHCFGFGGSGGEREPERAVGELQRDRVLFSAHHLPTPTWTSRKRAPGTACPTWPTWPGSPLPQFGVPSIT